MIVDRILGYTDCSFVARIAGRFHRIVAVDNNSVHTAVVDHNLRAVDIVAPAGTIGHLVGKCSHSE